MSIISHRPARPAVAMDLPAGFRFERHMHDNHQLVYMSSGASEVRTDAGSWIAPPDRAIWIPAGCPHAHRFHGPTSFHSMGFATNLIRGRTSPVVLAVTPLARELIIACSTADLPDPAHLPRPEDLPDGGHYSDSAEPAHTSPADEPADEQPALPAPELARMRRVLLDQLRRCPEQPLRRPVAVDPRLRDVCDLVEADLTQVWTLAALGRRAGVAERTLSRLFRTEFAMTYPQWRTQLRLYHATQLLAEGASVTTVAHRCGWATPSAFIDVYRQVLGDTPGRYRAAVARPPRDATQI
ncbi:helix-turn-helix transcriptional regulator [Nocardia sp. NEAU-G5]|uniref:Helix-turn-helix transcriptional regulator n=1 Tax=Nocardia albiluteola TaxID=2842303 RepID=A0ABS6B040_9NOCA|nr:helix-turn-helix transcriptional regulator [Nocardia albiluteola]MBU3063662.1 helix-turn-helix transcriptional regulator [Nocardia albiluteola]